MQIFKKIGGFHCFLVTFLKIRQLRRASPPEPRTTPYFQISLKFCPNFCEKLDKIEFSKSFPNVFTFEIGKILSNCGLKFNKNEEVNGNTPKFENSRKIGKSIEKLILNFRNLKANLPNFYFSLFSILSILSGNFRVFHSSVFE